MNIATGNQPPFTYQWTFPDGHTTDSDPFIFNITLADAGDYTLLATDGMHCTDQKTIHIEVEDNPVAAFQGFDTLIYPPGYFLDAGAGYSTYLWNTGDTTENIEINAEGMYIVRDGVPGRMSW